MHVRINIERLIADAGIPKEAMDIMLCHNMKRLLNAHRSGIARLQHHFILVRSYENFRMKNRVILISPTGKALCLLKTQFAKKPKNPV